MNTEASDNTQIADNTVVQPHHEGETRVCPSCGHVNPLTVLLQREYRCEQCGLELAHVDFAANGAIRGIFGWLLAPDAVIDDRYKIKAVLGKGGFGATYLVDDLRLAGKRRALKEVPKLLFDEYETTLLSRLDHPAIPDIIDHLSSEGMVYLVLKFGGSSTLGGERKRYPDHRIPQEKLLPWMRQLCAVLIYLHKQTPPIIHRDLKPDNILLNEDERIMLIDFGIAKEARPDRMTRTLGRAATLGFSPPEQVMGTGTDERADIYALGATFYALLTGQNPPAAHERVSGKDLAPPSEFVPDVLPEVEDAIIQSLSINMHHRQQTVREFALALGGMDWIEDSRPIHSEEEDMPTISAGQASRLSHLNRSNPSAGLRLPTASTAASRRSAKIPPAEPQPVPRFAGLPTAVGLAAGIAALATGVAFYWLMPARQQAPTTPAAAAQVYAPAPPAQPAGVPKAVAPRPMPVPPAPQATDTPVPPPVQPAPAPSALETESPPDTPAQPVDVPPPVAAPKAAPAPAEGRGSAHEVLRSRAQQAAPRPVQPSAPPKKPKAPPPPPKKKPAGRTGGNAWDKAHHELDNFLRQ